MTCRADKFFAKKVAGGSEQEQSTLHARAASPDGYHSAREPSDFNNDTDEELQQVESKEEEPMVESDNSHAGSALGHASLHSQRSTMENRDWKRTGWRLRATHSTRATNAKKGIKGRTPDGKKSKVVLSMFRDSQKEGALEYTNWRAEVEEYIKKGYEDNKIKDAMLFSLERKARRNFRHCDEHGDLTPAKILNEWTCRIMPRWISGNSMPGCVALNRAPSSRPRTTTTVWSTLAWPYANTTKTVFNLEN